MTIETNSKQNQASPPTPLSKGRGGSLRQGEGLLGRFLKQTSFTSVEDYNKNLEFIVPENFNFAYDVMDVWAEEQPDKLALLWTNDEGAEIRATFADLKRESDQAAAYLQSLGIGKGDMVMLILKRRYEWWISMLALHKLGAVVIPATHMLTKKDIVYRNQRASVKAIICVDEPYVVSQIEAALPESPTVKTVISLTPAPHPEQSSPPRCLPPRGEGSIYAQDGNEVEEVTTPLPHREGQGVGLFHDWHKEIGSAPAFVRPAHVNDNDDTMLMYFTSGTSGEPKMVAHDFLYAMGHLTTGVFWHNLQPDSIHLTVADTGWGKAVWGKFYGQWFAGATVFVFDHEKFNADTLLRQIEKYKVTSFCAPPTIYRFMIREDLSRYDLSSLRYCTTAGEALNPAVFDKFKEKTGIQMMEGFGQTETTMTLGTMPWMKPKPGSMGMPNAQYDIDLIKPDGTRCEDGEKGEIVIKAPSPASPRGGVSSACPPRGKKGGLPLGLFKEYYRDEELTREAWHDGLYHTGDVAWRDEDGYYWFEGRIDDVIKSSGYRIGPFEVESALMTHPAVVECAITGVPDDIRGMVVKATVVLGKEWKHRAGEELIKELQNHVKHVTAPYKYPRIIEFVDELPKTISGKIRRVEIREKDKGGS